MRMVMIYKYVIYLPPLTESGNKPEASGHENQESDSRRFFTDTTERSKKSNNNINKIMSLFLNNNT